jgi:hypothetical protein
MYRINDSWKNAVVKLNGMIQSRDQLLVKLEAVTTFSEYLTIRKEIDRLNRHIEVVDTLTEDRKSDETKRKMTKEYAYHTTK